MDLPIESRNSYEAEQDFDASKANFPSRDNHASDSLPTETVDAAYNDVETFIAENEGNPIDLATAIVGETVVAELLARNALSEIEVIQTIIGDAIAGAADSSFVAPKVEFATNGEIATATADTVLPQGVRGAFVPGENGEPGTILLSEDLKDAPDLLADVMLEELGEALGSHLEDLGFDVATGDVGNRIMKVVYGEELSADDFTEDASGGDATTIKLDGKFVEANTSSTVITDDPSTTSSSALSSNTDVVENYESWGYSAEEFEAAEDLASAYPFSATSGEPEGTRADDNFVYYRYDEISPPTGISSAQWKRLFAIYGSPAPGVNRMATNKSGEYMSSDSFARAILDGALHLDEPSSTGGGAYEMSGRVNFQNVSPDAIVESIFKYIQNKDYGGDVRSALTIEEFDEGTNDVLGDVDGITKEDFDKLVSAFGDWQGRNAGDVRFTRNGAKSMFTEGGLVFNETRNENGVSLSVQTDGTPSDADPMDTAYGVAAQFTPDLAVVSTDFGAGSVVGTVGFTDDAQVDLGSFVFRPQTVRGVETDILAVEGGKIVLLVDYADIPDPDAIAYSMYDADRNLTEGTIDLRPVIPDVGSGESLIVGGQWQDFGYYGDKDGDAVINGEDPDSGVENNPVDVPANFDVPEGAVVTEIYDSTAGEEVYGVPDVRALHYIDPTTGAAVYAIYDMTAGSATYGQAIIKTSSHTDGSLETQYLDEEPTIVSADELAEVSAELDEAEEADSRRLTESGYSSESEEELANYVETQIPGATITETFAHNNIAWVVYTDANDVQHVKFKYAKVEAVSEYMASRSDPVYGDIVEGEPGWDSFMKGAEISEQVPGVEQAWMDTVPGLGQGVALNEAAAWSAQNAMRTTYQVAQNTRMAGNLFLAAKAANFFGTGLRAFFYQDRANAQYISVLDQVETSTAIDGSEAITAETDPGAVGEGRPAYFIPEDAEILGAKFVPAESGPYGVDTKEFVYTRPGEANTIYVVSSDNSDPGGARDGLVLHATKTVSETVDGVVLSDVTTYDSFGTETDTVLDVDLSAEVEPITEAELVGDPETDIAHIENKVLKIHPDAEILEVHSAGPLTYASYQLPGQTGTRVHMLERITTDYGGHSYEAADGWLNGPVTQTFFEAFNHFQKAVGVYAELQHYYAAGTLAMDVLEFFLQDIDFSGIASMFAASATSTALTPRESATVRHVGTAAALVPFVMRGAVTAAEQWATAQGGPSCYAFGGNCMNRARRGANTVDLEGENGNIEAIVPPAPPGTPLPSSPLDTNWQLGAQHLVSSTNPDGLCVGMSETFLYNRLEEGISQTDNYAIQAAAQQAAPVVGGLADDTSRSFVLDQYHTIHEKLSDNMSYFRSMANGSASAPNWLSPDVEGYGRELVYQTRYASATAYATNDLELDYQHLAYSLDSMVDFVASDESRGKAFALNFISTRSAGHEASIVHELDGSFTLMEPNFGVVRFQDKARLLDFFERNQIPGVSMYDIAEVKVATDPESPTAPEKLLTWYRDLTGEDARTYGN